jgi:hypothetical protein
VPEHSQGIDAANKTKARKRHIAIDMLGLLLAVMVTAASVQDCARVSRFSTIQPPRIPQLRRARG